MNEKNTTPEPEEQLPPKLAAELGRRMKAPFVVPISVDEAILADARIVLERVSAPSVAESVSPRSAAPRRSRKLTAATVSSLAVALLFMVVINRTQPDRQPGPEYSVAQQTASERLAETSDVSAARTSVGRRGDLDENGTIDILDAFLLARQINDGRGDFTMADLNLDGRVDLADVDAIALTAVTL
ncbi:MAG: dockerin type I repeat-containing protein [Planctomycetaceae bacterium]|nr:dockerin type I repeat-containing protein [Planctomycetaceae bacterium]